MPARSSLKDQAMAAAKRCLDEVDADVASAGAKPAKHMPPEELKEAIRKAIYDNLRDFGPGEMDGTASAEGKTCRQMLSERKQQNWIDSEKYPCGKLFYIELRKMFRSSAHPLSLIDAEASNHDTDVSPCLLKSMT